jgi:hypothetical protein
MPFVNHLWQSTLFAAAVWLVVLMMRKKQRIGSASVMAGRDGKVCDPVFSAHEHW